MKPKFILVFLLFFFLLEAGCVFFETELFIVPKKWPQPVYNFKANPLAQEKIKLGRFLFYDPILSRDSTISCASCHSPYNAFAHYDHALSHGIDDKIGTRNAPALMNLAWQKNFMWDGAVHTLDAQPLSPLHNTLEMDEKIQHVILKLQRSEKYRELFRKAYGDSLISGEQFLKSISQFLVTLVSANSKFDRVLRKEEKFNAQEKNGYAIFLKNCNACHTAPLFTNNNFENNGLNPDPALNDVGRFTITQQAKDSFCFKVPTLRNIEFSAPYMHDGRFKNLSEVLKHYSKGIHLSTTLSKQLRKQIELSEKDRVDLTAFLLTLTDKSFLFNSNHTFPKELLNKN
jgi:cytochrome c peroxidase